MPQSLFVSYVHIVFSTKKRFRWFQERAFREDVFAYLAGDCINKKCQVLIINGFEEHVHILLRLDKGVVLPDLIRELKEHSSKWIKAKGGFLDKFNWQRGYGCFSVSATHIEALKGYIANQEAHHQELGFQDEYRRILRKNGVPVDERYVWD